MYVDRHRSVHFCPYFGFVLFRFCFSSCRLCVSTERVLVPAEFECDYSSASIGCVYVAQCMKGIFLPYYPLFFVLSNVPTSRRHAY